uniref:Thaumatin-like protein 1 n=1 Tax=Aegilops tauschii TaxID=37682 RepID=R7VZD8_AEGTA
MGEPRHHCKLWLLLLALAPWLHASTGAATTFTIANYCAYTIWPGTLAGSGTPQLSTTGFELGPGQTVVYGAGAIACRSACEAFGQDRYCCSGAYGTPAACRPTSYSSVFKMACPRAYSYAYDDSTSTFTCSADDYTVAFCLPTSGIKESDAVFLGAQIIGGRGTGAAEANDIAPPAYGNGGAGAYPPPTSDSYSGGGPGGASLPPVYNYGPGGDRIPPAMRISSASTTTYIRPWLPLLLLLLCFT